MKRTTCSNCSALISRPKAKSALIMFVGLSVKPETDDLCPTTNTGKLIGAIEDQIAAGIGIYRTNAVKCAPLDKAGKLRYPTDAEMLACLPSLRKEIKAIAPRVIVPLGGQVSRFLLQHMGDGRQFSGFSPDFSYDTYSLPFGHAMPIHHPSYIWIYKRKRVDEYVMRVVAQLTILTNT